MVCGLICRTRAISSEFLDAGRIPPCPGFAPCESFNSIILTWGCCAFSPNNSGLKFPSSSRQPTYPVQICQIKSPPCFK